MAYNLPSAWDPGFVLPKNVHDEGLERRAFVTKWLPRGTYDAPKVGTGGYMVPQYVMDEDYGQGTFTTKWQPRGTYNGPKVPHWLNQRPQVVSTQMLPGGGREVTIQALGDDPLPDAFEIYGQRAASGLIQRVATLPPSQRASVLKSILDQVDRSLWTRTQEIFARYVKQGMAPANAFPLALARAMGAGLTAEVLTNGLRRTAPQAKSLLGLGCYGCQAVLGAMGDVFSDYLNTLAQIGAAGPPPPAAAPGSLPPAPTTDPTQPVAMCAPPAGFTWVAETPTVPGHWERPRAGQVPQPGPCGPGGQTIVPVVRDQRKAFDFFVGPFGFNLDDINKLPWSPDDNPAEGKSVNRSSSPDILFVSPDVNLELPTQAPGSRVRPLTPDVLQWLAARLREEKDANGKTDTPVHFPTDNPMFGFPEPDAAAWFQAMGIGPDTPLRMHVLWNLRTAIQPFAGTQNPANKQNMVMHIRLAPYKYGQAWDATNNPMVLKVWLNYVPVGDFWDRVTGALTNPMILINPLTSLQAGAQITAAGIKYLSDLGCDLLKDPQGKAAAQVGAAAVASYYGMPPQAGADGVNLAAAACGLPPPPAPPVIPHSIWPTVLLAGGAVAAVAILATSRKKKAP